MEINMSIVERILENKGELLFDFCEYSKVYLNTTENIKGIMSRLDLENKDVLSVAGSGDQALNAYLKGAKSVTLFDLNPLAFAMTDLKITGARKLSHIEFCNYFIPVSGNLLDYHIFNKLSNYVDEDTAIYFDYLYSKFDTKKIFNNTMRYFHTNITKLNDMTDFIKRDNYEKLQEILEEKEPFYLKSSLTELPEKLHEYYDVILLSNISDSIEDIWDTNVLKSYKRFIHVLSKKLNKGGIIQCGYVYSKYPLKKPLFAHKEERQKIFFDDEFKEYDINTFVNASAYDDTVIYFEKKRRKVA